MSLKRSLILTAALALSGMAIRSQAANSDEAPGQRPAPIFAAAAPDGAVPPAKTAPSAASSFDLPASALPISWPLSVNTSRIRALVVP